MKNRKYILTEDTRIMLGYTLYRIKAVRDFGDVKVGDIGGWIGSEDNLSHNGCCWVYDNASVCGNTRVCGNTSIYGNTRVCGDAEVKELNDYIVFKNHWSSGRYFTWTKSNNMYSVGCFYGTGEELIKKAYGDSETSGREYKRVVDYVNSILNDNK